MFTLSTKNSPRKSITSSSFFLPSSYSYPASKVFPVVSTSPLISADASSLLASSFSPFAFNTVTALFSATFCPNGFPGSSAVSAYTSCSVAGITDVAVTTAAKANAIHFLNLFLLPTYHYLLFLFVVPISCASSPLKDVIYANNNVNHAFF